MEDAQLEVWWGHEGDSYDPFTQVLEKSIEIDVMLRGGERRVLRDDVPLRQFTYQEMLLLASAAGFKVLLARLCALDREAGNGSVSGILNGWACAGDQDIYRILSDIPGWW